MKNFTTCYQALLVYTVEEFLELYRKMVVHPTFPNKSRRLQHWYHLIINGNTKCVVSGKELKYVVFDKNTSGNSYHWNFYTEEGLLLTLDHIRPKGRGGSNDISNIQPMLEYYNIKKGKKLEYATKL